MHCKQNNSLPPPLLLKLLLQVADMALYKTIYYAASLLSAE